MSYSWNTDLYIQGQDQFSGELLSRVISRFLTEGFTFLNPLMDLGVGGYWIADPMEFLETPSWENAIRSIAEAGQGTILLWFPREDNMDVTLSFQSYEFKRAGFTNQLSKTIAMGVDKTHLTHESQLLRERRYRLIFDWSKILAEEVTPIYACGDWDNIAYIPEPVIFNAISRYEIPRLSWWSYYSNFFVDKIGRKKLTSAAVNSVPTESGIVIVMRAPLT